jgi:hypothetical protein
MYAAMARAQGNVTGVSALEDVFLATENIGEATRLALEAAHAWLERNTEGQAPTGAAK